MFWENIVAPFKVNYECRNHKWPIIARWLTTLIFQHLSPVCIFGNYRNHYERWIAEGYFPLDWAHRTQPLHGYPFQANLREQGTFDLSIGTDLFCTLLGRPFLFDIHVPTYVTLCKNRCSAVSVDVYNHWQYSVWNPKYQWTSP